MDAYLSNVEYICYAVVVRVCFDIPSCVGRISYESQTHDCSVQYVDFALAV